MKPNQKLIQLQMKLCFNQNYAILAGSPWEETVGSRKGHYFGGSKASSSSSFTFILSLSLSLAPIPHSSSLPLSLISPLILREQRQWSLPAVPLLFKAFTVAILDILIKHDTTYAHTQAHRLCVGLSGVSCVAVWVLSLRFEMAELVEEQECCRRELIVAITWAGVHNGSQ